jgi:hypothetical protein
MSAKRRAVVFLLLGVSAHLALGSCKKVVLPTGDAQAAGPKGTPAALGLAGGEPQLARAIRLAVQACRVTDFGTLTHCQGEAEEALDKVERGVGLIKAQLTYCRALDDADHQVRLLAAGRINRQSSYLALREEPDAAVLTCLLEALSGPKPSFLLRPVARAAAFLATRLGQEERLYARLEASSSEQLREEGYRALWPNGRLRVLPRLRALVGGKASPRMKQAIVRSLSRGGELQPEEQRQVCAWLIVLMKREPLELAAAVAEEVCPLCQEPAQVLEAARAWLAKEPCSMPALRVLKVVLQPRLPRLSPVGCQQAAELLTGMIENPACPTPLRQSALSALLGLNKATGRKVARKMARGADAGLRSAIEELLRQR